MSVLSAVFLRFCFRSCCLLVMLCFNLACDSFCWQSCPQLLSSNATSDLFVQSTSNKSRAPSSVNLFPVCFARVYFVFNLCELRLIHILPSFRTTIVFVPLRIRLSSRAVALPMLVAVVCSFACFHKQYFVLFVFSQTTQVERREAFAPLELTAQHAHGFISMESVCFNCPQRQ